MRRLLIIGSGLVASTLLLVAVVAAAATASPTLTNDAYGQGPEDLVFNVTTYREVPIPAPTWTLTIPWSRDGLGGADSYLGEEDMGLPVSGGATCPLATVVGPGPVVAVEDRGSSRVYDNRGQLLAVLPGYPIGFGPEGQFVAAGGTAPLHAHAVDGSVLWQRDPWHDAHESFGLEREAALGLVQGHAWACCAPSGQIFWTMRLEVGSVVTVPNPDAPAATLQQWEPRDVIDALFVYGPDGDIISFTRTTVPAKLIFTPQGTVFGCPVVRPDGTYAHREFSLERGTFTFRRALRLPVGTIWGAGTDGSILCPDSLSDDQGLHFTVFRDGVPDRAVGFRLPAGHGFAAAGCDGQLYTTSATSDAYTICGWTWPVPD